MRTILLAKTFSGILLISAISHVCSPVSGAENPSAKTQAILSKADEEMRKGWESWNEPFKPFRIFGNIYYVGAAGVSSFLIADPKGHILIDTGFEMTVPRITNSLAQLGFKLSDIKILLSSHAHLDHTGGHALMKSLTGAKIFMSAEDANLLAGGGTTDHTHYSTNMTAYPPAVADHILKDGEKVTVGDTTLVCHLTPGHTKGCTSWTMDTKVGAETRHVVFFGSTTLLEGVELLHNPKYPNIVEDFTSTFQKLKSLPCDIFLAPHGSFFNLHEKFQKLERGEKPNPFIDSQEFSQFVLKSEHAFQTRLAQEKAQTENRKLGN